MVKVSVGILTYNHGLFIKRAVEHVLSQEVDFDCAIVIADDCSTDNTVAEVEALIRNYPGRIRLLKSSQNVGIYNNSRRLLRACGGDYIAMLDGDDWWSYSGKLQAQIELLEKHPDASGCFHDAEIALRGIEPTVPDYNTGFKLYSQMHRYNRRCYPWDVLERTVIPTSSLVFKNNSPELINEISNYSMVNHSLIWVYHLLIIKESYFLYINEPWSKYNNHASSYTKLNKRKLFIQSNILTLQRIITDSYYKNLKHHIYFSLANETTNLLFSDSVKMSFGEKIKCIFLFNLYSLKHLFYRTKNLLLQMRT
ncbi:MAG: glycosyltransferase involved in cell wall biosynthesis [Bacteroidia bacterium]|jgi:glycosyltransferase involved in cell wall biosynthesis